MYRLATLEPSMPIMARPISGDQARLNPRIVACLPWEQGMIAQINPDEDNPFAILELGDGTYMQTFRTHDGFHLEHQLVNAAGHYEISGLATADQVVAAFVSYAFGKNEWLENFTWQLQQLR